MPIRDAGVSQKTTGEKMNAPVRLCGCIAISTVNGVYQTFSCSEKQ